MSDLIDMELHWWRKELMMFLFHTEDTEAICRISLSRRDVPDKIMWLKNTKGLFLVKSAYGVAMQVRRGEGWIENSSGCIGKQVWRALWKLRIPNKVKVFGWRACLEILPTRMNLARRKVVVDNICLNCTRFPKTAIHALWNCEVAKDVWSGSLVKLQK